MLKNQTRDSGFDMHIINHIGPLNTYAQWASGHIPNLHNNSLMSIVGTGDTTSIALAASSLSSLANYPNRKDIPLNDHLNFYQRLDYHNQQQSFASQQQQQQRRVSSSPSLPPLLLKRPNSDESGNSSTVSNESNRMQPPKKRYMMANNHNDSKSPVDGHIDLNIEMSSSVICGSLSDDEDETMSPKRIKIDQKLDDGKTRPDDNVLVPETNLRAHSWSYPSEHNCTLVSEYRLSPSARSEDGLLTRQRSSDSLALLQEVKHWPSVHASQHSSESNTYTTSAAADSRRSSSTETIAAFAAAAKAAAAAAAGTAQLGVSPPLSKETSAIQQLQAFRQLAADAAAAQAAAGSVNVTSRLSKGYASPNRQRNSVVEQNFLW
uniref:Uncharacterized protein n=1 Tax=Romanomermis culicivorax TaxID=13658 RepID=A0A915KUC5_ROMCU